jgi:apolipoprotein N-acyltransferase
LLGFISGVLSCLLVSSSLIYVAREQKTYDHVVWPGLVFALVVLIPISRWAGDSWPRIVTAFLASSVSYPIAWWISVSHLAGPAPSWVAVIADFAGAGLFGGLVLAGVFLYRRPGWARSTLTTVVLGALIGGLMGANLRAAMATAHWPVDIRTGLGLMVVLWQTVVGASLGAGVKRTKAQSENG